MNNSFNIKLATMLLIIIKNRPIENNNQLNDVMFLVDLVESIHTDKIMSGCQYIKSTNGPKILGLESTMNNLLGSRVVEKKIVFGSSIYRNLGLMNKWVTDGAFERKQLTYLYSTIVKLNHHTHAKLSEIACGNGLYNSSDPIKSGIEFERSEIGYETKIWLSDGGFLLGR